MLNVLSISLSVVLGKPDLLESSFLSVVGTSQMPNSLHSVTIQWPTGTNLGASFNVFRSQTSGSFGTVPLNSSPIPANAGGAISTFTDTTATAGTWFYVVQTVVAGFTSVFSNQVTVTLADASAISLPSPPIISVAVSY